MMKHKWHKEIKAWADGAEIEKRTIDCDWLKAPYPNWHTDANVEYRIRPQPKEPQYLYAYNINGEIKLCEPNGIIDIPRGKQSIRKLGKIPLIVESNDD